MVARGQRGSAILQLMQQQQCGHPDTTIGCLSEPVNLGGITLANRIAVSPMCQYSAEDGAANDWHLQGLGSLSLSGAALVIVEQTAVEPAGGISPWEGGGPLAPDAGRLGDGSAIGDFF